MKNSLWVLIVILLITGVLTQDSGGGGDGVSCYEKCTFAKDTKCL